MGPLPVGVKRDATAHDGEKASPGAGTPADRFQAGSMSTDDTTGENPPGTDQMYSTDDLARRAGGPREPLGVDADGREHYHTTQIGGAGVSVVWVMDGETVAYDEVLMRGSDYDIETWIAYVADRCGWDHCRYDDAPWGEWLAKQLASTEVDA